MTQVPEPTSEPEPEGLVVTQTIGSTIITMRVGEREIDPSADDTESDDDPPDGFFRVEVSRDGLISIVERDIFTDCFLGGLELEADFIYSDGERLVFDVSHRCVLGEDMNVEHLVLASWPSGLSVLYEGTSRFIDRRGLAMSVDKREFYYEVDEIAVYRHTVEWCDEDSMDEAMGEDAWCQRSSPRKLKLLERVPITLPPEE